MINISDDLTFALGNRFFSYVFSVTLEGMLEHKYFGKALSDIAFQAFTGRMQTTIRFSHISINVIRSPKISLSSRDCHLHEVGIVKH